MTQTLTSASFCKVSKVIPGFTMLTTPDSHILLEHLIRVWRTFERKEGISSTEAYLSNLHLLEVIGNALVDMNRMSGWHLPGKLPDRHKYAGFVARWVAKVRPIQFSRDVPLNLTNQYKLNLNARFAVHVMDAFLEQLMPKTIARHMIYWFSFRDERGETLAMIAYCAEEVTKAAEQTRRA